MRGSDLFRPTWIEIDLAALEHNFRQVKNIIAKDVKVLCVVKADAYGHGMVEVSKRLAKCGADYFGVASIDEAIKLRKIGIRLPILILENIQEKYAKYIIDYSLTQCLCTEELANRLNYHAKKKNRIAKVHIKIDTGMGRLGLWHKDAIVFIKKTNKLKNIKIEGIYTHFPSADTERFFTKYQIRCFESLIKKLKQINIDIPLRHIANSIGVIDYKDSHFNLVRPGLMLYGIYPKEAFRGKIELKPVLNFKTKIMYIKRVPAGRSISYGRTFITSKSTNIATIPVGYSDGYLRDLSNKAEVIIRGKRCRIIGRVCMDQTMIDLGDLKGIKIGEPVVLVGRQANEQITLEELAKQANTISYELACSIGRSNTYRFYKKYLSHSF
jgi:alanine racemase